MSAVLFAPVTAAAAVALASLLLRVQRWRQGAALLGRDALEAAGEPAILFFSGSACTICHTAQRPALERLQASAPGRVTVREVDVAVEPELARRFRVMSLPTTVVIDPGGRTVAVNAGYVSDQRLRRQLTELGLLAA